MRCILPICEEFVVVDAESEDETRDLILSLDDTRIKIYPGTWARARERGHEGYILSDNTNIALSHCNKSIPWAFYIQADEGFHEAYHPQVKAHLEQAHADQQIQAIGFQYRHFWRYYSKVADEGLFYAKESRLIRNNGNVLSWGDGQSFRAFGAHVMKDGQHFLRQTNMFMHHYGWARSPQNMPRKALALDMIYHDDSWLKERGLALNVEDAQPWDYGDGGEPNFSLNLTAHPKPYHDRILRHQAEGWVPNQFHVS